MTIDKIKVGKSIETFGLWQRLDLEVVVSPDEDPEKVYEESVKIVDKLLKINVEQVKGEEPVDRRVAAICEDIAQCTEIDQENALGVQVGLLAWEAMAQGNPEIKAVYDLRMNQLKK